MDGAQARSSRLLILGLIFVVAVLAAFLYTAGRTVADPDQFWHVATGKWIVEHRQVPVSDPFSWYAKGHRWIAQGWLFGVLAYGVQSTAGWKGLYLFSAVLDGLLVLLVYALARARGARPMWSFLIMTASLSGLLWGALPRPQIVTWCLVALTALLLQKGRWPWALLTVLLGVNMHGPMWPLYVLLFAYYEFPKRWWLVPAAVAVTLVNPNPAGVFLYPFQAFLSPVAAQIAEFQPTALWDRKLDLAMYVGVLLAIHRKRIHWRDALFALALVVLSLSAIRHVQWFYVLVLPILAPYIAIERIDLDRLRAALARAPIPARLREALVRAPADEGALAADEDGPAQVEPRATPPRSPMRALAHSRIPELLLIGALALTAIYLGGRAYRQRVNVDGYYPPSDMIAYLKLHKIDRFFNVWQEGGYLIYQGVPPMIDGRGDPYNPQKPGDLNMASDYMDLVRFSISPRDFLMRYDIEYMLLPGGAFLSAVTYDPAFHWVKASQTHVLLRFDIETARKDAGTGRATTETVTPNVGGNTETTATSPATPAP